MRRSLRGASEYRAQRFILLIRVLILALSFYKSRLKLEMKPVMIKQDDTPEVLQRRIMEQAEWKIMPMAINLIANGKVKVVDRKVIIEGYEEEKVF